MALLPPDNAPKRYDLEERTFIFANDVRAFLKLLPRTRSNAIDGDQLIRSSGSVGANYREANEASSKRDFIAKAKISLRESKESILWLRLLDVGDAQMLEHDRQRLLQEARELLRIFCSILRKSGSKNIREQ